MQRRGGARRVGLERVRSHPPADNVRDRARNGHGVFDLSSQEQAHRRGWWRGEDARGRRRRSRAHDYQRSQENNRVPERHLDDTPHNMRLSASCRALRLFLYGREAVSGARERVDTACARARTPARRGYEAACASCLSLLRKRRSRVLPTTQIRETQPKTEMVSRDR